MHAIHSHITTGTVQSLPWGGCQLFRQHWYLCKLYMNQRNIISLNTKSVRFCIILLYRYYTNRFVAIDKAVCMLQKFKEMVHYGTCSSYILLAIATIKSKLVYKEVTLIRQVHSKFPILGPVIVASPNISWSKKIKCTFNRTITVLHIHNNGHAALRLMYHFT